MRDPHRPVCKIDDMDLSKVKHRKMHHLGLIMIETKSSQSLSKK